MFPGVLEEVTLQALVFGLPSWFDRLGSLNSVAETMQTPMAACALYESIIGHIFKQEMNFTEAETLCYPSDCISTRI